MKPASCGVCKINALQSPNGDWVTFANYKSLSNKEIGHPDGLEWFCEAHINEAKLLSNKNSSDAIKELILKYPATDNSTKTNMKWWHRIFNH